MELNKKYLYPMSYYIAKSMILKIINSPMIINWIGCDVVNLTRIKLMTILKIIMIFLALVLKSHDDNDNDYFSTCA